MKQKFKTNINCGNCVKSVSPFLNQELDIENWEVDTDNADKILTIEGDIEAKKVEDLITEAGFFAQAINEH